MTLPRGFKAQAERDAVRIRDRLGIAPDRPVDPHAVAEHLGVAVVSADDIVPVERLEEIERLQAFAFSAATFKVADRDVVVTNPLRSDGRLASDIAHELAHLHLEHQLSEIREIEGLPFRTCRPDQEEQATSWGGTLLLPRPLLMRAAGRGDGPEQIAKDCGVTVEMARFRYNTTGVAKQARRRSG
jgi:Zn-dependent peptidase ImmA (M78 family)